MSLNLRGSGNPLTQNQVDSNFTFLYNRDITGSTVTGTTLLLYKQDGTVLATQLPSNSGGTGIDSFVTGFTFTNNNTLTISRNQGLSDLPITINNLTLTGLTVNGSISASTYLGISQSTPGAPVNSIQFNGGNNVFSGSSSFTFTPSITGTNLVSLNGNIQVTGSSITLETSTLNSIGYNLYNRTGASFVDFNSVVETGTNSMTTDVFTFGRTWSNTYIRNSLFLKADTVTNGINSGIPTKIFNFIVSQNSNSQFEWHYNTTNTLNNSSTAKMILSANTGNLFTSGSYSTTALTLRNTPTLNNSNTQILVRNSTTGNVEYRDASTISGGTGIDTFTTGFTYSNNNLTISRNQGQPALTVTINNFTGLTINGAISATTYLNLPPFITGGTYSAGTLSLLTNGNTVNVTGFSKTINAETIEWQNDQTVDYTKKSGIDDPVIFFDSSNNSFDSPSSITVTLDPNLSFTDSDIGKRNWKMIFPTIQRVEDGNTWIVKQGGSGVTSVNLVEYKAGRVTPHVLEFWWDPNFSGGRYRIAKYELEEAENDGTTVDPAIGLNFYSKIKFAGQIWGGASYGNSGGSTIIPAGSIIYVKDVIVLNQGTITPTGTTIGIGLSTVNNNGSLGNPLTTSASLTDFGVQSNDSRIIFKNPRTASYYNSGSGGTGNANMFFVDNTIGAVRTSVPVMISLTTTTSLTDGVIQVYVPYMVIQPRLSGTPYSLIDNTYDLWVTESNWSALNPSGVFTGNTSASCVTDFYVTNIYGCSPITIKDSIQSDTSTTTGLLSFAFGNGSVANGDYSHAEGQSTVASGGYSHAEGGGTQSIGQYSHAEGYYTQAIGGYSHAEGYNTYSGAYAYLVSGTSGNNIVLNPSYGDVTADFVSNTIITVGFGTGSEVLNFSSVSYDNITSATTVTVSNIGLTTPYCILPNPLETGIFAPTNADLRIGGGSHAEGNITQSIGLSSHAEGDITQAIGAGSHAEGYYTQAIGGYSHAEGYYTQAIGDGSHSQGFNTITSGIYSFASGSGSTASGIASFIHSSRSVVTGDRSVVLGGVGITGTSNNTVYVPDFVIKKSAVVPTGSTHSVGEAGSITWDNGFFYVRNTTGWTRTTLSNF